MKKWGKVPASDEAMHLGRGMFGWNAKCVLRRDVQVPSWHTESFQKVEGLIRELEEAGIIVATSLDATKTIYEPKNLQLLLDWGREMSRVMAPASLMCFLHLSSPTSKVFELS